MENEPFFFLYLFYALWAVIIVLFLIGTIKFAVKKSNPKKQRVLPESEDGNFLFRRIRDELRDLGENMIDGKDIFCQDYLVCNSPEGPGQIKMGTMGKDDYISVHVSIDLYAIGELYRRAFLGERKGSICLIPGRGVTADPRKVAMDFHQLSSEIKDVYIFLTGIEARAKEARASIDKEATSKKAEVDRKTQKQIAMLLKPKI
jgi:hypothetical protein